MFDLNKHMARLLMDEPFFTVLSRQIEKRKSNALPTAGVKLNKETGQFELFYNPEFFAGLTDYQKKDVLMHELYHCIFEHVSGRLPFDKETGEKKMTKMWNIATDLAINSHLSNLPDGCVKPGVGQFEDFPEGKTSEWYLKKLEDMVKNGEEISQESEEGQFDSHEDWDDAPEDVKAMARERMKESVKKAAQEAGQSSNWGSMTSQMREQIMERIQTKLDWRKMLRYFVKTSQKANKQSSMKHINKRYPYIHAGRKTSRTAKIAIAIDQSGSVSDEMLALFFSELNSLAKFAEFTVIPFDTEVDESLVYTWKKGENKKWERVMSGGTCFDAPTKYVNSKGFDGMLVLTDMMAPKPISCKCQRMWLTTKRYAARPYFKTSEKVVVVD